MSAAADHCPPHDGYPDAPSPATPDATVNAAPTTLPDGEYAIAEILGHRTIVGRISEVERFGTKLMAIEPVWQDRLLDPVLVGGASIYQLTPCSREVAQVEQPKRHWNLPASIRVTVPEPAPALPHFITGNNDEDTFA